MPDTYTDDEIVELYRRGKNDRRIIQKLCELSCKSQEEVQTILQAAGEVLPETPDREKKAHGSRISHDVWRKIIADRLNGAGIAEICDTYHVCKSAVGNWRRKAKALGILLPDHQITSGIQCIPDKIRKEVEQMEEKKTEFLDEETEKETACDIAIDVLYLLKRHNTENFKIESFDGDINVNASIPAKEAAV